MPTCLLCAVSLGWLLNIAVCFLIYKEFALPEVCWEAPMREGLEAPGPVPGTFSYYTAILPSQAFRGRLSRGHLQSVAEAFRPWGLCFLTKKGNQ